MSDEGRRDIELSTMSDEGRELDVTAFLRSFVPAVILDGCAVCDSRDCADDVELGVKPKEPASPPPDAATAAAASTPLARPALEHAFTRADVTARPGERIVAGWIRDNRALHDALDALLEAPGGGPLSSVLAFEDGALVLPACEVREDALAALLGGVCPLARVRLARVSLRLPANFHAKVARLEPVAATIVCAELEADLLEVPRVLAREEVERHRAAIFGAAAGDAAPSPKMAARRRSTRRSASSGASTARERFALAALARLESLALIATMLALVFAYALLLLWGNGYLGSARVEACESSDDDGTAQTSSGRCAYATLEDPWDADPFSRALFLYEMFLSLAFALELGARAACFAALRAELREPRTFFDVSAPRGQLNAIDSLCAVFDAVRLAAELVNAYAKSARIVDSGVLSWARFLRALRLLNSGPVLLLVRGRRKAGELQRELFEQVRAVQKRSADALELRVGRCTLRARSVQRHRSARAAGATSPEDRRPSAYGEVVFDGSRVLELHGVEVRNRDAPARADVGARAFTQGKHVAVASLAVHVEDRAGAREPGLRPIALALEVELTRRAADLALTDVNVDVFAPAAFAGVVAGLARVRAALSPRAPTSHDVNEAERWLRRAARAARDASLASVAHGWVARALLCEPPVSREQLRALLLANLESADSAALALDEVPDAGAFRAALLGDEERQKLEMRSARKAVAAATGMHHVFSKGNERAQGAERVEQTRAAEAAEQAEAANAADAPDAPEAPEKLESAAVLKDVISVKDAARVLSAIDDGGGVLTRARLVRALSSALDDRACDRGGEDGGGLDDDDVDVASGGASQRYSLDHFGLSLTQVVSSAALEQVRPFAELLFAEPPELELDAGCLELRTLRAADLRADMLAALLGGVTNLERVRLGACAVRLPSPDGVAQLMVGAGVPPAACAPVELRLSSVECWTLPFKSVMPEADVRRLKRCFAAAAGGQPDADTADADAPALLADAVRQLTELLFGASARAAEAGGGGGDAEKPGEKPYSWKGMLMDSAVLRVERARLVKRAKPAADAAAADEPAGIERVTEVRDVVVANADGARDPMVIDEAAGVVTIRRRVDVGELSQHHKDRAHGGSTPTLMPLALALDVCLTKRLRDGALVDARVSVDAPLLAAALLPTDAEPTRLRVRFSEPPAHSHAHTMLPHLPSVHHLAKSVHELKGKGVPDVEEAHRGTTEEDQEVWFQSALAAGGRLQAVPTRRTDAGLK